MNEFSTATSPDLFVDPNVSCDDWLWHVCIDYISEGGTNATEPRERDQTDRRPACGGEAGETKNAVRIVE